MFDPGRFMPDAEPPARFAYMPFGAGPRVCVGAQFALAEATLVVLQKPPPDAPTGARPFFEALSCQFAKAGGVWTLTGCRLAGIS